MRGKDALTGAAFFCLLFSAGCVASGFSAAKKEPDTRVVSEEAYRQKALSAEKDGRLQEALWAWRVVAQLDREDPRTAGVINTLESAIADAAGDRFRKGVDFYQNGAYDLARDAFLATLRLDPKHDQARWYLKTKLQNMDNDIYVVKKGDSFSRIAGRIFNDPTKAAIIAYFNELDPEKPLLIGKTLVLPSIESKQLQPRLDVQSMLESAKKALDAGYYQQALAMAGRIKAESSSHKQADDLIDNAFYQYGLSLLAQKHYLSALNQFKKISPRHKNRERVIDRTRYYLRNQAIEQKLAAAEADMRQGDYKGAIDSCQELLAEAPDNKQAADLRVRACYALGKQLIDNNRDAEALEVLGAIVDQHYEDTDQLHAQARGRLNARAEAFYRSGVKHFLNEALELAIRDWRQALALNPNHPKAAQDIENAERLLQKWRGLDN